MTPTEKLKDTEAPPPTSRATSWFKTSVALVGLCLLYFVLAKDDSPKLAQWYPWPLISHFVASFVVIPVAAAAIAALFWLAASLSKKPTKVAFVPYWVGTLAAVVILLSIGAMYLKHRTRSEQSAGVPIPVSERDEFLARAASGDAASQLELGKDYLYGFPKDTVEAAKWLRKAADQRNVEAEEKLWFLYLTGDGVARDPVEAERWERKAAEQGVAQDQFGLGSAYAGGVGVFQDAAEAAKWWRMAADQGNADAQEKLGNAYSHGLGVSKDTTESWKWYRKAAEQGSETAQLLLGYAYAAGGCGLPKDTVEGVMWLRKAADQGNVLAQDQLGMMYLAGDGVAKDGLEGLEWFRKAANLGYTHAQFCLGMMYGNGDGVPKDDIEALAWFNISAASGDETSVNNRGMLERRIGRDATLLAQQRSKEILKEIKETEAKRLEQNMKKLITKTNYSGSPAIPAR